MLHRLDSIPSLIYCLHAFIFHYPFSVARSLIEHPSLWITVRELLNVSVLFIICLFTNSLLLTKIMEGTSSLSSIHSEALPLFLSQSFSSFNSKSQQSLIQFYRMLISIFKVPQGNGIRHLPSHLASCPFRFILSGIQKIIFPHLQNLLVAEDNEEVLSMLSYNALASFG